MATQVYRFYGPSEISGITYVTVQKTVTQSAQPVSNRCYAGWRDAHILLGLAKLMKVKEKA